MNPLAEVVVLSGIPDSALRSHLWMSFGIPSDCYREIFDHHAMGSVSGKGEEFMIQILIDLVKLSKSKSNWTVELIANGCSEFPFLCPSKIICW